MSNPTDPETNYAEILDGHAEALDNLAHMPSDLLRDWHAEAAAGVRAYADLVSRDSKLPSGIPDVRVPGLTDFVIRMADLHGWLSLSVSTMEPERSFLAHLRRLDLVRFEPARPGETVSCWRMVPPGLPASDQAPAFCDCGHMVDWHHAHGCTAKWCGCKTGTDVLLQAAADHDHVFVRDEHGDGHCDCGEFRAVDAEA